MVDFFKIQSNCPVKSGQNLFVCFVSLVISIFCYIIALFLSLIINGSLEKVQKDLTEHKEQEKLRQKEEQKREKQEYKRDITYLKIEIAQNIKKHHMATYFNVRVYDDFSVLLTLKRPDKHQLPTVLRFNNEKQCISYLDDLDILPF